MVEVATRAGRRSLAPFFPSSPSSALAVSPARLLCSVPRSTPSYSPGTRDPPLRPRRDSDEAVTPQPASCSKLLVRREWTRAAAPGGSWAAGWHGLASRGRLGGARGHTQSRCESHLSQDPCRADPRPSSSPPSPRPPRSSPLAPASLSCAVKVRLSPCRWRGIAAGSLTRCFASPSPLLVSPSRSSSPRQSTTTFRQLSALVCCTRACALFSSDVGDSVRPDLWQEEDRHRRGSGQGALVCRSLGGYDVGGGQSSGLAQGVRGS